MEYAAKRGLLYCYSRTTISFDRASIADQLKKFRNGNTSESEYRSWCYSIPALTNVLHKAGLDALTLALEYETPIGDRIDVVLLGARRKDHHDLALIIELKQWSYIGPNDSQSESMVSVCVSEGERRFENRLHPVQQTLTYSKHLNENHSNVASGKIAILRCQYLHNFERKQQLFEGLYEKYEIYAHETYIKGEEKKLAEFVKKHFRRNPIRMQLNCSCRENINLEKSASGA